MRKQVVYFATGNRGKFMEVAEILRDYPLTVERLDAKGREIQSDSVEEIAEDSANNVASRTNLPVFVEDTGLFIRHLHGFPGPYAAYVHRTIGLEGILAIMESAPTREAYFRSAVAFASPGYRTMVFVGEASGKIATSIRGSGGFGYDPIFEPDGGDGRTFGEMTVLEKNRLSHRAMAVRKFAEWYVSRSGVGGNQ
jgi:XTP/dITP diphosphohydrolase